MAVITIVGIRHANPMPPQSGQDDKDRPLSSLGRQQVAARREDLKDNYFDSTFSSPALRAVETNEGVTDGSVIILNELTIPTDDDGGVLMSIFANLGNDSPAAFIDHSLNRFQPDADPGDTPVERFGTRAGEAILKILGENFADPTILVTGHAVLTQLAVHGLMEVSGGWDADVSDFLLNMKLEEAGAFFVTFDTKRQVEPTFGPLD